MKTILETPAGGCRLRRPRAERFSPGRLRSLARALVAIGCACGLAGTAHATRDLLISNPATNSILRFDGETGAAKGAFVASGAGGLS